MSLIIRCIFKGSKPTSRKQPGRNKLKKNSLQKVAMFLMKTEIIAGHIIYRIYLPVSCLPSIFRKHGKYLEHAFASVESFSSLFLLFWRMRFILTFGEKRETTAEIQMKKVWKYTGLKSWVFSSTLFEIFIFCPKIQLWILEKIVDFLGWKTRENVVVFDFLPLDNFNFTRKIVKKKFGEKLVKMLWFCQNWIFGQKLDFSNNVSKLGELWALSSS